MLDEAGWTECSISVSNSLDEYIIRDILRQGAKIDLFGVGRTNPEDNTEKFSMSVFALNTCQEANGVSWLHGEVSKKMFSPVWPGYFPEELHVDYVTNGVHMPTWAAHEWKDIYAKYLHNSKMIFLARPDFSLHVLKMKKLFGDYLHRLKINFLFGVQNFLYRFLYRNLPAQS